MNIRISLAIIVFFFFGKAIYAQDSLTHKNIHHVAKKHAVVMPKYPREGYISITGGLGIPTGSFAANESAATIPGGTFAITAAFPGIISHCGIAFKFDYGFNGLNRNQFFNNLNTNSNGISYINSYLDTVGVCSYKAYLTGLYLTYTGKHLTIDIRILMGVMTATLASATANYYDPSTGNSGTLYEYETSASAFAFDFGIEARYRIKPRVSIFLSADYLHAEPSFALASSNKTLITAGNSVEETGQQSSISQAFSLYNLSIGVGYTIFAQKPLESKTP